MTGSSTSLRARLALGAAAIALAGIVAAACAPQTPPTTTTTTTVDETTTTLAETTTTVAETTTTVAETTTTVAETTTTTVAPAPQLVVSKTTGLDRAGETVTVTGTGFDMTTLGTRPPLSGQPGGVYVVFGSANDTWRPSAGAASSTRQAIIQRWALPQASYDALSGAGDPAYVLVDANGNFTTTLTVSTLTAFTKTNVGIFTYGGSGANNASNEIFVPVKFAPQLTVSKTADLDPAGETVTVTGTGFDMTTLGTRPPLSGQPGGVYVVFGSANDTWRPSAGAASSTRQAIIQRWALPQASYDALNGAGDPAYVLVDANGNFTTTLSVSTLTAFTKTNVGIFTYGGSGANNAANEIFVPVGFAAPPAG